MKISKAEFAVVLITVIVFSFTLGYFFRGESSTLPYTAETGKSMDASSPSVSPDMDSDGNTVAENPAQREKMNINTATVEELMALPGIGKVMAQRIVDFREQYGNYRIIEEITDVSGIGEGTFEKIKDLITVA